MVVGRVVVVAATVVVGAVVAGEVVVVVVVGAVVAGAVVVVAPVEPTGVDGPKLACVQILFLRYSSTLAMYWLAAGVRQRPENHTPVQPMASPLRYSAPRSTVLSHVSLPSKQSRQIWYV